MVIALLLTMSLGAGANDQPFAKAPPAVKHHVDVVIEAMPTDARGRQIVTIQLRIMPNHVISSYHPTTNKPASGMTLAINTRNPKTQVNVIYPKGRVVKLGDTFSYLRHEGDVAIQAIVQRVEGDNSDVEGRLDYRVGVPFT